MTSCDICDTRWHHVTSCDTMWHHVTSCDTMWHYVTCDTMWVWHHVTLSTMSSPSQSFLSTCQICMQYVITLQLKLLVSFKCHKLKSHSCASSETRNSFWTHIFRAVDDTRVVAKLRAATNDSWCHRENQHSRQPLQLNLRETLVTDDASMQHQPPW